MLYSEIIAVCSEIHTKHKWHVVAESGVLQLLTTTPQRVNNPFWLWKSRGFRRGKYSAANNATRERNWIINP